MIVSTVKQSDFKGINFSNVFYNINVPGDLIFMNPEVIYTKNKKKS